jgi:SAM-dependent methyltransferase
MYLGTTLDPQAYYQTYAEDYDNPHAEGIRYVLDKHIHWLKGSVLDMGCGNGLATMVLWSWAARHSIVGIDAEPNMVERYKRETEHEGSVACFWDELPHAESAVFCYSLHLCPESRAAMVGFRLIEAGVQRVIVVSPLKSRAEGWTGFSRAEETADGVGPEGKTIYGRVYTRNC